MNNKTIIEFGFRIIRRIMEILEGVIPPSHRHLPRSPYPWQQARMVTLHFWISAIWEVCVSQDRLMEDPKSRFFMFFYIYFKGFPFISNLEGSVAKRLDLWTSNRPASIHALPGRAEDWLGWFAYSWFCHINIWFIYSSYSLITHYPVYLCVINTAEDRQSWFNFILNACRTIKFVAGRR